MSETQKPFQVGDRVANTANKQRRTIGIVTKVIDSNWCEVLWNNTESNWTGTIPRNGDVIYAGLSGRESDRIVRVKLSVRITEEV